MGEYRSTYFFTKGRIFPEFEGKSKDELKSLLGGKGYGLYLMHCVLDLRVPAVLNLPTFHANRLENGRIPNALVEDVRKGLREMEEATGKKFGDPENPLLVSARSGAKFSLPGMMDTILNIGLNDEIIARMANGWAARFWLDSYRRLLQMFGDVVLQIRDEHGEDPFEHALDAYKKEVAAANDLELGPDQLRELISRYKALYTKYGFEFPQSPEEQILRSAEAVFRSWGNERAVFTRRLEGIPDDLGTAVNIQEMVFGNKTSRSATGVFFTRDKSSGIKRDDVLDGTVLFQAQGEDVVAGIRNSSPLELLRDHEDPDMRSIYAELKSTGDRLEKALKNMQDTEFTVEEQNGKPVLFWLQIRDGKRSARAESVIAAAMHDEGIITKSEAVMMVNPERFEELLFPQIEEKAKKTATLICKGSAASPGAAYGKVAFSQDEALELAGKGEPVILVTVMTSQEDVKGMKASKGILTTTGTKVSHAAIMATAWGIPAVVGAADITINKADGLFTANGFTVKRGDYITITGTSGEVFLGSVETTVPSELDPAAQKILEWCGELKSLDVRANAEATESQPAYDKGARGIGLFRTEHMFLGDRLPYIQTVLFGNDKDKAAAALQTIFEFSKEDFKHSMRVMNGHGVTIRLLDAPLHEFFSHDAKMQREENPMLGHRSVRMAITNPEIPEMQIRAVLAAAAELIAEGLDPKPEIELPLVIIPREVEELKRVALRVATELHAEKGVWVPYAFGIMVETPAAALQGKVMVETLRKEVPGFAKEAHAAYGFASFGTNDLTQTTLAISRDDADRFLPHYVDERFFDRHPFVSMHPIVERLVRTFVEEARAVDPHFEIFICGEHGGDVYTVGRLHEIGLTGISMSPGKVYRSIIKAAQSQIKFPRKMH
ncbi:MAG: putative PEP-binding protein [Myxococcota bacterium]|jgi:pyruvate,orthophosphate dikinase|nr:putative PEP-binding protein [Myxococcota bacterium]